MADAQQLGIALSKTANDLQRSVVLLDDLTRPRCVACSRAVDLASYPHSDTRAPAAEYLDSLENELRAYVVRAQQQRNALLPVNQLSQELLGQIFHLALDDAVSDSDELLLPHQLSFSHVCSRWRRILLDDPSFWTTFSAPIDSQVDVLPELLLRSKGRPFAANIYLCKELEESIRRDKTYKYLDLGAAHTLLSTLETNLHRLNGLCLVFHFDNSAAVLALLSLPCPTLLSLSLEFVPASGSRVFNLPNNDFTASLNLLQNLRLSNIQTQQIAALPTTALESLSLIGTHTRVNPDAIARLCSRNRDMEVLHIAWPLAAPQTTRIWHWHTPSLRTLELRDVLAQDVTSIYRRLDVARVRDVSVTVDRNKVDLPDYAARVFAHMQGTTEASFCACTTACGITLYNSEQNRELSVENRDSAVDFEATLERLAYDDRILLFVVDLTINPCIWSSMADILESAHAPHLNNLRIDFGYCHRSSRPAANVSRPLPLAFATMHVSLGSKKICCPSLHTLELFSDPAITINNDTLILSMLDLLDLGPGKLELLEIHDIEIPGLAASGALDERADEVVWD